jgi:hypothetical protein
MELAGTGAKRLVLRIRMIFGCFLSIVPDYEKLLELKEYVKESENALRFLPARIKSAEEKEKAEMLGKYVYMRSLL